MHVVGDDHGPLEESGFQRGGTAGDQRHIARFKHGVGLPGDDLHVLQHATVRRSLFKVGLQRWNRGHNDFDRAHRLLHAFRRCKKARCEVVDFRFSAARQNGQHGLVVTQTQASASGAFVRLQGNDRSQRVTDIGGTDAVLCQQFHLKRKDAQHVISALPNFLDALGPPRPDRRTDEVQRLDTSAFERALQVEIEVGCVDADEQIRRRFEQALVEPVADRQNFAVMAQHLHIASDGEFFTRPPGIKLGLLHVWAANALRDQVRPMGSHAMQQVRGQHVA